MATTSATPFVLRCGDYELDLRKKTMVMGIVNVTPDSFSDGGRFYDLDRAVEHAKQLVADGADIIDIGGESTRPGAEKVSLEEELRRVIPVVKAVAQEINVPISIDTYKAEVAKQAIEAGAHIINDVWGAKADEKMAEVAAFYDVPIILMHNRHDLQYRDLISDMISDLMESVAIVKRAGVKDENIILDPGIGFAKTLEHNLEIMRRLDEFAKLGYPLLLGTSRKRFIGHVLDLPVDERVEGTGATVCLGIAKGAHIVRVHDVLPIARMVKMMDAMLGKGVANDR
ncbi:dihydropteroate synthase [Parageobacillus thermoglucosidasius]|uniref:Dihydropteroate synthase n=3 Tax=Anoxybacillaceae TaxID=3120669 RepID=A0AAN1D5L0_PARTM|nr:dihydropteroate synthase [Parageobacillus thermoglucosidasius]KYD12276.1 Dihydropteroate synthase [Anoxybacillus flavithermus]REK53086.1 MAG: dihydropteroate synthase [Geobacillus sp.]AEH46152.1 dihydropteroate synthase [Parageobacillus thermoglucosidasius C56-YS93]ALF09015.1 dihydropteroate synthase [Parageobacillus thermoglucosidasius]ANZ29097.1 dihydropteroate synthase [Parageobacillus thermoglucosidasius]